MADLSTALWIKNVRRRAGFSTQAKLADEMGVGRGAVGNWESGRGVPSMAHAERFAVVTKRKRAEVLAKFGYPIGGGDPVQEAPIALPPEWTDAMQSAVAAGIEQGIQSVLDRLAAEGLLRGSDTTDPRPSRRRPA